MNPLKIAIYRTSSIGDVVLATACISLLSNIDRPVQIFWIGRGPSLPLLKNAFPSIKEVFFEKSQGATRLFDIASELKVCNFLLDLQCNLRSKMLSVLLARIHGIPTFRARKMQVFRGKLIAEALMRGRKKNSPPSIRIAQIRQTDLMLKPLLAGLSTLLPADVVSRISELPSHPKLYVTESETPRPWQKELRVGQWIAVAPGAAHVTKRAPLNKWCEILVGVREALEGNQANGLGLVFLGDDRDREFSIAISKEIEWKGPVMNLAGRLSLWETALALAECQTLISNDSSLAHISESVGTPVTVLFGPTVEAFGFAPWKQESRTFSSLIGCRPCSKHGKVPCKYGDQQCFVDIDASLVAKHLLEIVQRSPRLLK